MYNQNINFELTSKQTNYSQNNDNFNKTELVNISVKVIFIGDTNTGKTSTLEKIQNPDKIATYTERTSTIGVEFGSVPVRFNDKLIKFQIWDTAGQEKYRSITSSFYKNCTMGVLFCDVTKYSSYTSLNYWINDLKKNSPEDVIILLVANKCDLKYLRQVNYEDLQKFANSHDINFIEISAENGLNISEILNYGGQQIMGRLKNNENIPGIRINNFIEVKTKSSICSECKIM